jgi:hypothetical protein
MQVHARGHKFDGASGYLLWTPFNPAFVDELKERIPFPRRRWAPTEKAWWIHHGEWGRARRLVTDHFDVELQLIEKPKPERPPESPRERKARLVSEAFVTLHLVVGAPDVVIRAAHKALALAHHPDRGGDLETMKRVNAAADLLLETREPK